MSAEIGPVAVESGERQDGLEVAPWTGSRNWSEATVAAIDRETERLIGRAHDRATALLKDHRAALDGLAEALTHDETLDAQELSNVLRRAGVEPVAGTRDRAAARAPAPAHAPPAVSHPQSAAATDQHGRSRAST